MIRECELSRARLSSRASRVLLLELAARVLHEQSVLHEGRVVCGLQGGARVARRPKVHERVRVVQYVALDDLAVGAQAVANLLLRAGLGKVAHVHNLRARDGGRSGRGCGRIRTGQRRTAARRGRWRRRGGWQSRCGGLRNACCGRGRICTASRTR